ncbi:hypothetical protein [Streptomyces nodosus]|uniref:hypothetical protein n=1 Tax=Streptomyces nodosus TaxID=40318 RepID=UPI003817F973
MGTQGEGNPAEGIARLEGYLLWNAHITEAHEEAGRFADRLPWLTDSERRDVESAYATDRLAVARATDAHIVRRITEIRSEYIERYERLRARCIAWAVICAAAMSAVLTPLALALGQ